MDFLLKFLEREKMRKILFVALAIFAICITVSAVSAEDSWSFSFGSESNTDGGSVDVIGDDLEIQDEEFTIPEGFTEVEKERLVAGESTIEGAKVTTCVLEKGNETILVKVHFADGGIENISGSDDSENVTIAGHAGFLSNDDENGTVFDFESDKKLVEIVAPNQELIEEVLK
jgi:hypothetical protein